MGSDSCALGVSYEREPMAKPWRVLTMSPCRHLPTPYSLPPYLPTSLLPSPLISGSPDLPIRPSYRLHRLPRCTQCSALVGEGGMVGVLGEEGRATGERRRCKESWSRLELHLSRSVQWVSAVLCLDVPFSLLSQCSLVLNQSSDMIGHDLQANTDCSRASTPVDCHCLK